MSLPREFGEQTRDKTSHNEVWPGNTMFFPARALAKFVRGPLIEVLDQGTLCSSLREPIERRVCTVSNGAVKTLTGA